MPSQEGAPQPTEKFDGMHRYHARQMSSTVELAGASPDTKITAVALGSISTHRRPHSAAPDRVSNTLPRDCSIAGPTVGAILGTMGASKSERGFPLASTTVDCPNEFEEQLAHGDVGLGVPVVST